MASLSPFWILLTLMFVKYSYIIIYTPYCWLSITVNNSVSSKNNISMKTAIYLKIMLILKLAFENHDELYNLSTKLSEVLMTIRLTHCNNFVSFFLQIPRVASHHDLPIVYPTIHVNKERLHIFLVLLKAFQFHHTGKQCST